MKTHKIHRIFFFIFLVVSVHLGAQTKEEAFEKIKEAIGDLQNKNHEKSLQTLTEVKRISEAHNWHKELFLAYTNIGLNYFMMYDYGEALKHHLIAHKISIDHLEPQQQVIAINNIAVLYLKEDDLDKADEYFLKAYEIAESIQDSIPMGLYATNVASVATEQKKIEKGLKYVKIGLTYLPKTNYNHYHAKIIQAKLLWLSGETEKAKEIALEILKLDKPENFNARVPAYKLLADIFKEEKNYEKAIYYANALIKDPYSSIYESLTAYKVLAEIYKDAQDPNQTVLYQDSIIWANDSVQIIKNGQVYENSRIKFELQNKEQELAVSLEKFSRERKIFLGALAFSLALLLTIVFAIRTYLAKLKQRKIISENNQKIIELELEQERNHKALLEKELEEQHTKSLLEKEILKNELENKNRKLTAKALSLSARNELIEDVLRELSHNVDIAKNIHLKKQLQDLKNHLKNNQEWDEFFTHFEEVNQGFIKNLKEKHPDLNSNDLRFISYLYMNLSAKEIASLLNITIDACRKRKERITKKLNLPENVELFDYITSF